MSLAEIRATLTYLIREAERDQAERRCYYSLAKAYKFIISPDIMTLIEENIYNHYCTRTRDTSVTLEKIYDIPVQIDYQAREKIELWRKIGD